MFSLQKFLGKDPKFFDLLASSANECFKCAQALVTLLNDPQSSANLHLVRQTRQNCKNITEEISELALKTFVTVLEREDIEALASALYKIPKPIEKFAERFLISRDILGADHPNTQSTILMESTDTVRKMVQSLRSGMNVEALGKLNAKLQYAEAEADNLELDLLRDLYKQVQNPIKVIVARDLYDLLEKAVDRCRDTGNVVIHICHKNS